MGVQTANLSEDDARVLKMGQKRKSKDNTKTTIEVDEAKKFKGKSPGPASKQNKKRESVKFTPETIDNEAETTRKPTETELLEIQKPENIKDVTSKRQAKRLKLQKLVAFQKTKENTIAQEKALNYLSKWKHTRSEWKYERKRQVWLQTHILDAEGIPDKLFDTAVEYLAGSGAKTKEVLTANCTKIIEDEDEEDDDVKFKRARTLLQFFQE